MKVIRFWMLDAGCWIRRKHPVSSNQYLASSIQNIVLLFLLLTLTGCLPSSCQRITSEAIAPADSLSRQVAARMTPDTLHLVRRLTGPEERRLEYPRTMRYGAEGRLFASDAERNSVYAFAPDGTFLEEITWEGAAVPYLAGFRGDTLLVFNPEARQVDFIVEAKPVRHVATPDDLPRGPLQYLTATDEAFYLKVTAKDFAGFIVRLDAEGKEQARTALPGSEWRHAGLLRTWGDSLLSLSGFFPIVDVLDLRLALPLDSMALVGFDSPMLRRTFAFVQGEARQAPLLSSAAAPAGERLFVLNMRPGWLRIDVFDRGGQLQHILVEEDPAYDKQFYPIDLAVRSRASGGYEIAVAVLEPVPELRVYRWEETD